MILTKTVNMNITNVNKKYYTNLGYDTSLNNIVINVYDLPKNSHCEISVKCDICNKTKTLSYSKYNKNTKNNTVYYSCSILCSGEKKIDFFMNKYGVTNPSKLPNIKEKQKQTNIKIYGSTSALQNIEVRQKSIDTIRERHNKNYKLEISKNPLKLYRNSVIRETRKHKDVLFLNWDYMDYYDNENIKENTKLSHTNKNYPTIDHKISILYGFNNNIDPKIIGNITNLCITKRWINSSKSSKNIY